MIGPVNTVSARCAWLVLELPYIFHLASDRDESSPPRVQPLRRRQRHGEQGVGRPEDLEASICACQRRLPSSVVDQCLPAESRGALGDPNASAGRDSVVGDALIWMDRHCRHTKPGLAVDGISLAWRDGRSRPEGPRMVSVGLTAPPLLSVEAVDFPIFQGRAPIFRRLQPLEHRPFKI